MKTDKKLFSPTGIVFFTALYLTTLGNLALWKQMMIALDLDTVLVKATSLSAIFMLLMGVFFLLASLLMLIKPLFKTLFIIFILLTAITSYFMLFYGTVFTVPIIDSIFTTDVVEAKGLLTWPLILFFLLLGILPAVVLTSVKIRPDRVSVSLRNNLLIAFGCLLIGASLVFANFKGFVLILREHPNLKYYMNPSYPLHGFFKYIRTHTESDNEPLRIIAPDAKRIIDKSQLPTLAILVVGETARSANFELGGYSRQTTPHLTTDQVVFYPNATSCGTSTAISVPCMFSILKRSQFDTDKASHDQNLLDVLIRENIHVIWLDNNTGCKGICRRVPTKDLFASKEPLFCNENGCYDDILLADLKEELKQIKGDTFIVLHQIGSHGPDYFHRYPAQFDHFKPFCTNSAVQKCNREEILNAYDNTILYTDYFLDQVIHFLAELSSQYNTAMIYLSDHGESLGEGGMYLHGFPYAIAPQEQTHIPMLFWLSPGFIAENHLNYRCFFDNRKKPVSQDNIFPTVLGLYGIKTKSIDANDNLFLQCSEKTL